MTVIKLLNAAKNAMLKGKKTPHCYRAHVIRQGFINDGKPPYDRADYLRQLEREVQSELDNMLWATEYAEPGYDKPKKGILFANWNYFPSDTDTYLEKLGYAIEWSDEWFVCDCMKAVRTSPDGWDWKPGYKEIHGALMCLECAKLEEGNE